MQSSTFLYAIVAATTVVLANPVQSPNAQPAPTLDVREIKTSHEKHQRSAGHHSAASVPHSPTASSPLIPRPTSPETPDIVSGVEYKDLNDAAQTAIATNCNAMGWITLSVCYDNSVYACEMHNQLLLTCSASVPCRSRFFRGAEGDSKSHKMAGCFPQHAKRGSSDSEFPQRLSPDGVAAGVFPKRGVVATMTTLCERRVEHTEQICLGNNIYDCVAQIHVQHCGSSAGKSLCREHKRGDAYSSNGVGVDDPWCIDADGSFVPPNGFDDHPRQDMRRDDKACEPWPSQSPVNITTPEQIRGGLDGYCYSEPEQRFLNETCAGKEPGKPMKSICVGGWTEDKVPMAAIYNCTSMIAPTTCGITPGDMAMAGPIALCEQQTDPEPQAKCIHANELRNRIKGSNSTETAKPT